MGGAEGVYCVICKLTLREIGGLAKNAVSSVAL